ncbi:MTH1187 family thiamine-binding protein [Fictibacillus sp. WQ 8-8]|uniref:MTH1187 family thiamine-binding protein n=1 Tax=unclassified Fictibacillus TaxID=2644029 RepID=UPI00210B91C9|nr:MULTISPECIES: MTH1187 family thiamine-binding protein [unclassified Fictibacillus]MCQ6266207.1 MTH1187 family thiamine-binding protein [Fictibacillus sp. WQ 8-8]MED2972573.1 MTH1187 family thiamine-binding protein [Fictibacillus sp. B-59209]
MAIIDITVIPIGTESPSVSTYVAGIQRVLEKYNDQINYELTSMNTIVEGELDVLLNVIKEMHEAPFQEGIQRVATNIRIDDRRDKKSTMKSKLESVRNKMQG